LCFGDGRPTGAGGDGGACSLLRGLSERLAFIPDWDVVVGFCGLYASQIPRLLCCVGGAESSCASLYAIHICVTLRNCLRSCHADLLAKCCSQWPNVGVSWRPAPVDVGGRATGAPFSTAKRVLQFLRDGDPETSLTPYIIAESNDSVVRDLCNLMDVDDLGWSGGWAWCLFAPWCASCCSILETRFVIKRLEQCRPAPPPPRHPPCLVLRLQPGTPSCRPEGQRQDHAAAVASAGPSLGESLLTQRLFEPAYNALWAARTGADSVAASY
jgi:hypothetical protein